MRVVLVSQVPLAVHGLTPMLRSLGHDPLALLCTRENAGHTTSAFDELVRDAPKELDVDWSRTTDEIHRQVRGWRFASAAGSTPGALTELDGETCASSGRASSPPRAASS